MRRLFVLPIAMAALILVGCAAEPAHGPTSSATTQDTGLAAVNSPTGPATTKDTGLPATHSPTGPAPAKDAGLPAIQIIRTGGFVGVHQSLTIDSSGAWSGPTGSGRLSDAGRERLVQIVTDPALPNQVAAAPPGQCCDMFDYELRVGGRTYAFGEPELGPLLVELLGLLHEETGF